MDGRFTVTCPYCGEEIDLYLEADVRGVLVQDCEVCPSTWLRAPRAQVEGRCNPWQVRVAGEGDERWVNVTKADGSE